MLKPYVRIFLMRTTAVITAILLSVAALGLYQNYDFLRTVIGLLFILLAGLFFLQQYAKIGVFAFGFGILFYPWFPFSLPQQLWVVIDILSIIWLLYIITRTTDSYKKGTEFEEYVTTIFKEPAFTLKDRTRDTSKFSNRRVESDMNPDFVFRNEKTGKLFAVECKWRSEWKKSKNGELGLYWDLIPAKRYVAFGEEFNMPVYIALGIGGIPEKPKEVYFLEAKNLVYPFLKQSFIQAGKTAPQMVVMG